MNMPTYGWTIVEWMFFLALAAWMVWIYRGLLGVFAYFAIRYLMLTLIIVLVYAIVFGLFGGSFGLPYLFWSDDVRTRIEAAAAVTLLLAVIGTVAFHVVPHHVAAHHGGPSPGPVGKPAQGGSGIESSSQKRRCWKS